MSSCLKGEVPGVANPQKEKMKACNKDANEKKLKGAERRKLMSQCLKG